jgi:formate hydrogenlyase subunit 4
MKLFVLGALLLRLVFPFRSGYPLVDFVGFVAGMLLLAIAIGVVESVMARLRLVRIPQLLVTACLLAAFGLVLLR